MKKLAVSMRARAQVLETIALLASEEMQREYQRAVPHVHVPAEIRLLRDPIAQRRPRRLPRGGCRTPGSHVYVRRRVSVPAPFHPFQVATTTVPERQSKQCHSCTMALANRHNEAPRRALPLVGMEPGVIPVIGRTFMDQLEKPGAAALAGPADHWLRSPIRDGRVPPLRTASAASTLPEEMQPIQDGPMTDLHRLVDKIGRTRDCRILAPNGQPLLREGDRLPEDLAEFYRLTGGAALFEHSDYSIRVVGPEEFVRANPDIVGCDDPDDISDTWYIVAREGLAEVITIDCSADRLGRCYDSFWDCHGVAGSCLIVALSFTDLLQRLFDNNGAYWYWLGDRGPAYGDAYGVELDP